MAGTSAAGAAKALHAGLMLGVGAYALTKERQESGCAGWSASRRQCADEKSVYVRGTAPRRGDSAATIKRKLVSVLSYHEKGGVWKRCFLLATVLAYLASVVARASTPGWTFALTHLVFFCAMYFWFNYLNYHHFRKLKHHGIALLKMLERRYERHHAATGEAGEGGEGGEGACMSAYKASRIKQASRCAAC